jgi:hypothetical protein
MSRPGAKLSRRSPGPLTFRSVNQPLADLARFPSSWLVLFHFVNLALTSFVLSSFRSAPLRVPFSPSFPSLPGLS